MSPVPGHFSKLLDSISISKNFLLFFYPLSCEIDANCCRLRLFLSLILSSLAFIPSGRSFTLFSLSLSLTLPRTTSKPTKPGPVLLPTRPFFFPSLSLSLSLFRHQPSGNIHYIHSLISQAHTSKVHTSPPLPPLPANRPYIFFVGTHPPQASPFSASTVDLPGVRRAFVSGQPGVRKRSAANKDRPVGRSVGPIPLAKRLAPHPSARASFALPRLARSCRHPGPCMR